MTSFFRAPVSTIAALFACVACSSSSPDDNAGGGARGIRVRAGAVDKVDLLLAIDNSRSMGDKQALLAEAIPDLITRLLTPRCVNDAGDPVGGSADGSGKCAKGVPEFEPVHDVHVGIVSSSLGSRGGVTCQPTEGKHGNDRGHLLARVASGHAPPAQPSNFLTWLPNVAENSGRVPIAGATPEPTQAAFTSDFAALIVGVGSDGCGYEAQLESAYRFLVQPDPYDTADRNGNVTELHGVDGDIIKQRHDFLRPDSLVAVVMLTDENDSTTDPLAVGGQSWQYEGAERVLGGTAVCATNPDDPGCQSCYEQSAAQKPECQQPLTVYEDDPNMRFFHMKQRFGIDARFPVERYVKGFGAARIPNRDGEHTTEAPAYVGNANCVNPLFAGALPASVPGDVSQLCNLPMGPRTPDMIVFALIGGVPWQLLTTDPTKFSGNAAPFKDTLDDGDWTRILGADPLHYDFTGIDPHMRESMLPREGLSLPDDALPREWNTKNGDLQYACTFLLPKPRDCTRPEEKGNCDCAGDGEPSTDSPLCDTTNRALQTRGKAYPTVNELAVAKGLGPQAVVASLCPRTLDKSSADYGYRPAVSAIMRRVKGALAEPCLDKPLPTKPEGGASCTLLEALPQGEQATACDPAKGLSQPDPGALQRFRDQQKADGWDGASLALPVCAVNQLASADLVNGSCETSNAAGWCYVLPSNDGKSRCTQKVRFSATGVPAAGAFVELQCSE